MADSEPEGAPPIVSNAIHLVRTTQQVHVQLSQMADQKASILMGATFVVFTVTIGQARGANAPLALLVLGAFSFLAAVLAVMAVIPVVGPGRDRPLNLLFFGSFTQLDEEEYVDRLIGTLASDEAVCRTMAHDIYQNGRILAAKKYRMLGWAYRVFLVGLTMSFLTFIAHALHWI